jgi:hypothetical protein
MVADWFPNPVILLLQHDIQLLVQEPPNLFRIYVVPRHKKDGLASISYKGVVDVGNTDKKGAY